MIYSCLFSVIKLLIWSFLRSPVSRERLLTCANLSDFAGVRFVSVINLIQQILMDRPCTVGLAPLRETNVLSVGFLSRRKENKTQVVMLTIQPESWRTV